jgi:hypothetical protein
LLEKPGTGETFASFSTNGIAERPVYPQPPSPAFPQVSRNKKSSPLLSIFSVPEDYRMNDPARRAVLPATTKRRRTMKYICLGYLEPGKFEGMTEDERHAVLDECFEHNDHLRANGQSGCRNTSSAPGDRP